MSQRVLLHPMVVGHGARLFVLEEETFSTGVLNLAYAPTRS
jgi:hypothetical protein